MHLHTLHITKKKKNSFDTLRQYISYLIHVSGKRLFFYGAIKVFQVSLFSRYFYDVGIS